MIISKNQEVIFFHENNIPCISFERPKHFDIEKIFDCGQCFRFDRVEKSKYESEFCGVAYGRFISVAQDKDRIYIFNSDKEDFEKIWRNYFSLSEDYTKINNDILSLSDNQALSDAVSYGDGIRILHQEPWEALCSFIISQNNNIPRIKSLISSISEKLGEKVDTYGMESHGARENEYSFPTPESIVSAGVSEIFSLKTGFRAKYIVDAAKKVSDKTLDLDSMLKDNNTDNCLKELCSIYGVGPKVASCVLLFGLGHYDAFPVDVWIKRAMAKYFGESFSPCALGTYRGIAQQYLFYYERYLVSKNQI